MPNTSILFETTKIGNIVLKNRLGVAPMTRTSASPEGFATDQMAQYYEILRPNATIKDFELVD
ncbi:hypothetical protein [Paenibacillus sp. F4]|uniref:oxidoreductase n=1 Tax=Paenibacillus sp. F4 TaxID=357385 RepID=UPI0011AFBDF5|nr:hypothetical protein [Paenibacillus sp. F4]